jgi:hypothetical protein
VLLILRWFFGRSADWRRRWVDSLIGSVWSFVFDALGLWLANAVLGDLSVF